MSPRAQPLRTSTRPRTLTLEVPIASPANALVYEPADNVYGRFRVLRRTDNQFVVHDTTQWPPNGPVFRFEAMARKHAEEAAHDRP